MNYRWIGSILIITGCSGCGFSIAAGKRREERQLWQLLRILQFMESELQYQLTPLPKLCVLAARQEKGAMRNVFLNLNRELTWQKYPDAGSCMSVAVQKSGEIPAKVRRLLIQLGHTLGRFDLQGQLQGIQFIKRRCEETLASIRKNRDEQIRSYQTLGVCAGAALAILLL